MACGINVLSLCALKVWLRKAKFKRKESREKEVRKKQTFRAANKVVQDSVRNVSFHAPRGLELRQDSGREGFNREGDGAIPVFEQTLLRISLRELHVAPS
jgi:hypothetical protein